MRIVTIYSHLNGHEWLLVHRKECWIQIEEVIASIDAQACRTKKSREKRMKGKMLFSPTALNRRFETEFRRRGWSESRASYWVTDNIELTRKIVHLAPQDQKQAIERSGRRPILSYNQTDFQKDRVSVEVQFGKCSFIAYDLFVKHLAFYASNEIDVGVEVLPMNSMQSQMSSGPGYYEAALYDMARHGRGSPAVPLVLVGVDQE